jgi:hypothetical protein
MTFIGLHSKLSAKTKAISLRAQNSKAILIRESEFVWQNEIEWIIDQTL